MKLAALVTATLSAVVAMVVTALTRAPADRHCGPSPTPASSAYDDIQVHGDDVERQVQMGTA